MAWMSANCSRLLRSFRLSTFFLSKLPWSTAHVGVICSSITSHVIEHGVMESNRHELAIIKVPSVACSRANWVSVSPGLACAFIQTSVRPVSNLAVGWTGRASHLRCYPCHLRFLLSFVASSHAWIPSHKWQPWRCHAPNEARLCVSSK